MEERLVRILEPLVKDGDLRGVNDRLQQLLAPPPTILQDDYALARYSGLAIREAEVAASLAAALRVTGLENLVSLFEQSSSPRHLHTVKRKRRKKREDLEATKIAKY